MWVEWGLSWGIVLGLCLGLLSAPAWGYFPLPPPHGHPPQPGSPCVQVTSHIPINAVTAPLGPQSFFPSLIQQP